MMFDFPALFGPNNTRGFPSGNVNSISLIDLKWLMLMLLTLISASLSDLKPFALPEPVSVGIEPADLLEEALAEVLVVVGEHPVRVGLPPARELVVEEREPAEHVRDLAEAVLPVANACLELHGRGRQALRKCPAQRFGNRLLAVIVVNLHLVELLEEVQVPAQQRFQVLFHLPAQSLGYLQRVGVVADYCCAICTPISRK